MFDYSISNQDDFLELIGIRDGDEDEAAKVIIKNHPDWKYCNQTLYIQQITFIRFTIIVVYFIHKNNVGIIFILITVIKNIFH